MISPSRKIVSYSYVFVMFITTLSLGGLLSNMGLAQSHSLGMLLSIFPIVLVSLVSGHWRWLKSSDFQIVSVLLLAIFVHFVVVALLAGTQHYILSGVVFRFILSFIFLSVILWSVFQMERYLALLSARNFSRLLNTVYVGLVSLAILSLPFHILDLVPRKQMLIFSEPSHFALVFAPFYLYRIFISSHRVMPFLLCLSLALMLQNLTLMVFAFLGYFLSLRLYGLKLLVVGCFLAILGLIFYAYIQEYDNFVANRLNLSPESKNLSVLILLSGYERAYVTMFEWSFIGVGFQQMGVVGPLGGIQSSIESIKGVTMNLRDGGTLFGKIVTEFGVFGILIVLAYLKKSWVLIKRLATLDENSPVELFYTLCFLGFFVMIFIRGVGYFSPSTFLFIIALLGLKKVRKKQYHIRVNSLVKC